MWKIAVFLLPFQVLLLSVIQSVLGSGDDHSEKCSQTVESIVEKEAGAYHVRISYADDQTCERLEILKRGRLFYKEEGIDNHYSLGNDWNGHHDPFLMNLTGRGTQLIIKKWTGGAHCCNSLLIFDVRGKFKKIADIYGGNYDLEIVDLDHDGIPEIRLTDDFLAYQFSSFAYSARADVILKYVHGHYSIAPELMKRPARLESFDAKLPKWRKLLSDPNVPNWPPPPFIQAMTDLIFSGNENLAFQLVDEVWPKDTSGKAAFLKSYREALGDSMYYGELKRR